MQPLVTRTTLPAAVVNDAAVREYAGFDPGMDLSQDRALQILKRAVIEQGEQHTGIVWAAATYVMDRLPVTWSGFGPSGIVLPVTPVFEVSEVAAVDHTGIATPLDADAWTFTAAAIELGRPWAVVSPAGDSFPFASWWRITGIAGWDADSLPESLTAWALVRIASLYDQRNDVVSGTITSTMPRDHTMSMLDRWTVRDNPYV